ncbi:MAG: stage IV sporulation protein A [Clostridiales bacterium]|nr:stage IV sporulation protein A [Clostridiales bacterium]
MDKNTSIYTDIAKRTNGDVYIGVVGPVRCGKSSFIQNFIKNFVLDNITNKHDRERAKDELPQSSDGNMVMTTKPQFVPNEAVKVKIGNTTMSVRLIDSVGFMVDGAVGAMDNDKPRLVKTPWSDEEIPFVQAAVIGTEKVISEHSTIAVAVTTDGSFGDIPRKNFVEAERRTIQQLHETSKPFVLVLNTATPNEEKVQTLAKQLRAEYDCPVLPMNVNELKKENVDSIMTEILKEFPIEVINIKMPRWLKPLPAENPTIREILDNVDRAVGNVEKIGEYDSSKILFEESDSFEPILNSNIELGSGAITFEVVPKEGLFYRVLSEQCGAEIHDDFELVNCLKDLTIAKKNYDKIRSALQQVDDTGYGIVIPNIDEMELKEPEIVRQGGRCGVKLKAQAPSLHIMKVNVETEVSPIMGGYEQSEDLAKYLLQEFENNPQGIWQTNMFGKSLESLVNEGINNKLTSMPVNLQNKLRKTLGRIVNEGKGGILCILL